MKTTCKLFMIFLAMTLLATGLLSACGGKAPSETATLQASTEPAETEAAPEEETASKEEKILTGRLTQAMVDEYVVANENMTKEELRQLCLDFFHLQLSFQWIPGMDVTDWSVTYGDFEKGVSTNIYYGGIPYQSKGFGSVYRWLEYYDEETAIFDIERAFAENGGYGEGGAIVDVETDKNGNITYKKYISFMTFFNQCSSSSFWGWGRVVNSVDYYFTADMTVYNGFIPVGGFTYPNMETIKQFGVEDESNPTAYDTDDVIADWNAANGSDAMFKCYALMKPADLLVSRDHTLMVKSVDIQYRADGTINENTSTVVVQEQIEKWARTTKLHGKTYRIQGETDNSYTFGELQKKTYIPYTFAEFLDETDPIDKAHLDFYNEVIVPLNPVGKEYKIFSFSQEQLADMNGAGVENALVFTTLADGKQSVSLEEFKSLAVGSNYVISDCFVIVKDKDGNEVLKNFYRALNPRTHEVSMNAEKTSQEKDENGNAVTISQGLEAYTDGSYTVEVSLQLSNGEKPVVFTVTLTA